MMMITIFIQTEICFLLLFSDLLLVQDQDSDPVQMFYGVNKH